MIPDDAIFTDCRTRLRERSRSDGSASVGDDFIPQGLMRWMDGLPEWWSGGGNVLFARQGASPPRILTHPGLPPPTNALVLLGCAIMPEELMLWGNRSTIVLGDDTRFPNGRFYCGDGALIAVGPRTVSTWAAAVDARNGGLVRIGADGLWATNVRINSDDMHAIRDPDGRRINAFGGQVLIEDRVWLAYEAMVLAGARIGHDVVVGARSVVPGQIPHNSVCVGAPATVVRRGTTWSADDLP